MDVAEINRYPSHFAYCDMDFLHRNIVKFRLLILIRSVNICAEIFFH